MDFLGPVPGISRDDEAEKNVTIKQRLLEHLNKFGVPSSEIGEVELVTMPRFFGFAFNPLNTYYCFEPDMTRVTKSNVLSTSPHFNNRTGVYEAHLHDPRDNRMDVALILRKYGPEPSNHLRKQPPHSTLQPRNTSTQGFRTSISFKRGIIGASACRASDYGADDVARIIGRIPSKVGNEGGGTIVRKKLDSFQKYSEIVVLDHLQSQSTLHNIPSNSILYISSPNFFLRLLMDGTDIGRALSTTFARGDWTTTKADLVRFLNLMLATEKSSTKKDMSSIVLAKARRRYHGVGGVSPFRSHKWQKAVKIAWGVATVWMEEKWFAATTVFVRDPYSIAERVAGMVFGSHERRQQIVDEEGEAGKLLGEFGR
ncbi:hypothetical protein BC829DRAFT_417539 [Chytridium lagenaria]|nr:hypothetical protein BC829DRAFT_417539 [Chytridium lagenaria]